MSENLREKCQAAIDALEACTEKEVDTYGERGYQEVKEMESEAPAPTPCVDQFNAVIEALTEYDGDPTDFDFGKHEDAIRATLKARQA